MWSPINKYAIPSKEERFKTNEVIFHLKTEVANTEEQIARALRKLIELRKEIKEREAWLAAIRKLSYDELAIIFTMCAEGDWRAPMSLGRVCRSWRDAVLATSRAWSFINLRSKLALSLLPLFLRRSGQHTFHIGLDNHASEEVYAAVMKMAHRVQCLAIPKLTLSLSQTVFPALTRLILNDSPQPLSLSALKRSQFPILRHLNMFYYLTRPLQIPDAAVDPPPIQILDINGYRTLDVFHIIQIFECSLKELRVTIDSATVLSTTSPIRLPQLDTLILSDERTGESLPIPKMIIPRLKTLVWKTRGPTPPFPRDVDLSFLAHLRVHGDQKIPLSTLPRLKVLQFHDYSSSYGDFLEPLLHDQSICPNLESIEICDTNCEGAAYPNVEEMVLRINNSRGGGDIKFFSASEEQLLPHVGHLHPVRNVYVSWLLSVVAHMLVVWFAYAV